MHRPCGVVLRGWAPCMSKRWKSAGPFCHFNSSPETIRLIVIMCVLFPLLLQNFEDLLREQGIDICHEAYALLVAYNGFDQRVMLTRGSGGSAVTRRLVSDRGGRLLGEYGSAGNQLFTEYIWLLPEAGDGDQRALDGLPLPQAAAAGGDYGSGGWMPLAVANVNGTTGVADEPLRNFRSTHLGVPVAPTAVTAPPARRPSDELMQTLRVDLRVGISGRAIS
jgi:hypothetical protein